MVEWSKNPVPLAPPPLVIEAEPTLEQKIMGGDVSTTTLRDFIVEQAELLGVSTTTAVAIAQCESGLNYLAANKKSTAESLFQFIDSTWLRTMERMNLATTTDKFDPIIQIKAGLWLLKEDGDKHWLESFSCWSKVL